MRWVQLASCIRASAPSTRTSIVSNEDNHFVWRAARLRAGGVYIGVGTDQNYLAARARPEFMVLLDFDQVVVDLALLHGVIFLNPTGRRTTSQIWKTATCAGRRADEALLAKSNPSRHAGGVSHGALCRASPAA